MANQSVALPAPAANGAGTAVDVSSFGATKTVLVTGNWTLVPSITVEINNGASAGDGGWQPIRTFQGAGQLTFDVAARWMRVTVQNFRGGQAPDCSVGGTDDGTLFANLPAPADTGTGAAVDISTLGLFKTIQIGGQFRGSVNIEISTDGGATYSTLMSNTNQGGAQSFVVAADFARVSRSGVPQNNPGLPIVNIGACVLGGGGTGSGLTAIVAPGSTITGPIASFQNGNGLSFGAAGLTLTGAFSTLTPVSSHNLALGRVGSSLTGSALVPAAISAGTTLASTGTIVISNANGVSFGMDGQTLTASIGAMGGALASIIAGTGTATGPAISFQNGNNVSFGVNGNTVTASVIVNTNTAASGIGLSAGTTNATAGVVVVSDANNVTFGLNGQTLTASVAAQTAFVLSNSNNVSFGTAGSTVTASASFPAQTAFQLSNSNGLTFGTAGSTVTASYSTASFANANNVSFGTAGSTVTASASFPAQSTAPGAIAAGTQTATSGTVAFANSNGLSFGMSGSSQITASMSTVVFSNSNNVTLGLNAGTLTASASFTQSTAPAAIAAVGGTITSGTASFSNANGVSFGVNGQTVTASVAAQTAFVLSNSNNVSFGTAGSTVTATFAGIKSVSGGTTRATNGELVLSNANGVSFGVNGNTVTASVAAQTAFVLSNSNNVSFGTAGSTVTASASVAAIKTITAGTTNATGQALSIVDSNGVSFGFAGNTLTASVAPQTAFVFSNANNVSFGTAGSTVTASASFSGGGVAISAGTQSQNTGTISFADSNGISFALSAGTITASVSQLALSMFSNAPLGNLGAQWNPNYLSVQRFSLPVGITASRIDMLHSYGTVKEGFSAGFTWQAGIYSIVNSVSSLSLAVAISRTLTFTNQSSYTGVRWRELTGGIGAIALPPGEYMFAAVGRSTYSTQGDDTRPIQWFHMGALVPPQFDGPDGELASANYTRLMGAGVYSRTTQSLLPSIAFTDISQVQSYAMAQPIFRLVAST